MFSILIPIYNFDVRQLVRDLQGQCDACGIGYEIVCFDDGSTAITKETNREISGLAHVFYKELPENLGRSAIRNALGRAARHDWLLFMDCDSRVVSAHFIKNYLEHKRAGTLVYGGRCYGAEPPSEPSLLFHWKYGSLREQTTAAQRNRSPWHGFMTNNFLIERELFFKVGFDETLRQYGHEDTLFGLELAKRQVPILHIDNPLEHIGLERVDVFLSKTEQGLENLLRLWQQGKPIETRLLRIFLKCRQWWLHVPLSWVFIFFAKPMVWQFKSKKPCLALFDVYKLCAMAYLYGSEKQNG